MPFEAPGHRNVCANRKSDYEIFVQDCLCNASVEGLGDLWEDVAWQRVICVASLDLHTQLLSCEAKAMDIVAYLNTRFLNPPGQWESYLHGRAFCCAC